MDGNTFAPFPHYKLLAYRVALDFVRLVHAIHIAAADMRKHARSSAGSCARADKHRCYSIARGELCEAVSAVEIDEAPGGCPTDQLNAVLQLASRPAFLVTGSGIGVSFGHGRSRSSRPSHSYPAWDSDRPRTSLPASNGIVAAACAAGVLGSKRDDVVTCFTGRRCR